MVKVSSHCGIGFLFYVQDMTLEPIHKPAPGMTCICNLTQITFQTINEIVALGVAILHGTDGHNTLQLKDDTSKRNSLIIL